MKPSTYDWIGAGACVLLLCLVMVFFDLAEAERSKRERASIMPLTIDTYGYTHGETTGVTGDVVGSNDLETWTLIGHLPLPHFDCGKYRWIEIRGAPIGTRVKLLGGREGWMEWSTK